MRYKQMSRNYILSKDAEIGFPGQSVGRIQIAFQSVIEGT
jgi:hypothetical protein